MEHDYTDAETLHEDDFAGGFARWHHEGVGAIEAAPEGGMRLRCFGSRQGREGCMAFFRPDLPDCVAFEYELCVRSQGGLIINYIAIRGINGEDMIADAGKLEPRTGIMGNYFAKKWGLQSYHVSFSRFNDKGLHTGTSNWRRNPGTLLMAHGPDRVREIGRWYRIRVVKDSGHCALYIDGECCLGFVDRDNSRYPVPDTGKFGFRLIGSEVAVDVRRLRVLKLETNPRIWSNNENYTG